MNQHIRDFRRSFQLKKEFWYTLLVDAGFIGVMWFLIFYFGNLVIQKSNLISQGRTEEEIQQILLSMQTEQSAAFLAQMQSFVYTFVLAFAVIVIGGLLLFSLSRSLIWYRLLGRKFKKKLFWKWNLLNFALLIPAAVYLFGFALIKLVLDNLIILFGSQTFFDWFNDLLSLAFLLFSLLLLFLVYYSFAQRNKVWESIVHAFKILKDKWKIIWPILLLAGLAVFLASSLLWLVGKSFSFSVNTLAIINGIVSLVLLCWFRIYVFQSVKDES